MLNSIFGHATVASARLYRYARFLITTLTFKTYQAWKKAGEPNPFARREYRLKTTTRHEMEEAFSGNLARHRIRLICLNCLRKQPEAAYGMSCSIDKTTHYDNKSSKNRL